MANLDIGNTAVNQAETVHAGVNAARCRISLSLTTSAGDVLRIGKIPHGAVPLQAVFYPGTGFAAGIWKFGTSASQAAFLSSKTYSVAELGLVDLTNAQISLSDDAAVRYEHIVGVPSAVVTVGYMGTLVVFYKMQGQTP